MKNIYSIIIDFKLRPKWMVGVIGMNYKEDELARLGTIHECVLQGRKGVHQETTIVSFGNDFMEYGETDTKMKATTHFKLKKLSENKTRVEIDFHFPGKGIKKIMYNLFFKPKVTKLLDSCLVCLKSYSEDSIK